MFKNKRKQTENKRKQTGEHRIFLQFRHRYSHVITFFNVICVFVATHVLFARVETNGQSATPSYSNTETVNVFHLVAVKQSRPVVGIRKKMYNKVIITTQINYFSFVVKHFIGFFLPYSTCTRSRCGYRPRRIARSFFSVLCRPTVTNAEKRPFFRDCRFGFRAKRSEQTVTYSVLKLRWFLPSNYHRAPLGYGSTTRFKTKN